MLFHDYTDHMNTKLLHALILHVSEGCSYLLFYDHTDHKNNKHLHELTLCGVWDYLLFLLYIHIDHKNNELSHVLLIYVSLGGSYLYSDCFIERTLLLICSSLLLLIKPFFDHFFCISVNNSLDNIILLLSHIDYH